MPKIAILNESGYRQKSVVAKGKPIHGISQQTPEHYGLFKHSAVQYAAATAI
jgi:hypothetical protein